MIMVSLLHSILIAYILFVCAGICFVSHTNQPFQLHSISKGNLLRPSIYLPNISCSYVHPIWKCKPCTCIYICSSPIGSPLFILVVSLIFFKLLCHFLLLFLFVRFLFFFCHPPPTFALFLSYAYALCASSQAY